MYDRKNGHFACETMKNFDISVGATFTPANGWPSGDGATAVR
jgi:hypothetical protein